MIHNTGQENCKLTWQLKKLFKLLRKTIKNAKKTNLSSKLLTAGKKTVQLSFSWQLGCFFSSLD